MSHEIMKTYKYRANLINTKTGQRRDSLSLINNELYASKLKDLNDPFEGAFILDLQQPETNDFYQKVDLLNIGIYSLCILKPEEYFPSNDLMWAHYANSHRGFCIEYDLDLLTKSIYSDIVNRIDIIYEANMPLITKSDLTDITVIQQKVFGTKSQPWIYENEIRLIFKQFGIRKYPQNIVTGIYFGLNIDLESRNSIIENLAGRCVKFYQMNRIDNHYKLSCSELNESDIYNYQIVRQSSNHIVDNYNILYQGVNKDKVTMQNFVNEFRRGKDKPINITIFDNIHVDECIDKNSWNTTKQEAILLEKHWIAYSSFDVPNDIWMYPNK